jgi:phosphoribosylformylglycinamidine synthase subunit PurQ / glutaminase
VCNGFQILTESGLLEGALLHNDNQKFICKNVFLKPDSLSTAITKELDSTKSYKIPIAHGEGRFFASDEVIERLEKNGQVIFRYCTAEGEVNDDVNPNGSINNIAGISNENGNVFGMMPHPERAADGDLSNVDGRAMFESLLKHCTQN